jgi:transcriptional regulator with XRE-family HTH domain
MNMIEVMASLQKLTNAKINQSEIAKALNKTRSDISLKSKRGSEVKLSDLKKLEDYFNVDLINARNKTQVVIDNDIIVVKIKKGQKVLLECEE